MTRLQEILARRNGEIGQHADARAQAAARKRAMYPGVAECIDQIRELFGEPKAVPYGREADGRSFGKPGERGVTPVTEKMETKDVAPARVRKGKPATKDRWYSESEES